MTTKSPENERKAVSYLRLAIRNLMKALELTNHELAIHQISIAHSDICDSIETIKETDYDI